VASSRIADSVGRVLGDRYRLIRPLGVGASAHVYVAEDINLRRRVAIKVLHPALAADEAFGRRFRAEAQAVAGLRHPNILRVYDWGHDDGAPYLVMELLEGGSLRALLDRGQLLSPAQAAAVGAEVARALDYAHRRGLVHRDIKPANLIFDDEGRITVADFGLARALAEATWTEPAGAVVGTARYAAPEQVRGESLDSRADVYALALVLIEATTGTVPFAADTTLATLMGRVERPVTVGADLGPLGPVLEAAGTVDPADRLDALGLALALDTVAAQLPPPGALPLAGSLAAGETERDDDPTDHPGRTQPFDREWVDGPPPGERGERDQGRHVRDERQDRDQQQDRDERLDRDDRYDPAPAAAPSGRRRRRRRLRWVALVAAVAILLGGGVAIAVAATRVLTPSHPVPRLTGVSESVAGQQLLLLHLHLVVTGRTYDAHAAAGTVIDQQPGYGTKLKEGRDVAVTLSRGPQPVPVPSLPGLTQSAATSVLATLGLKAGAVSHATSMTVAAGNVLGSTPAHGTLLPGQTVAMVVSTGKPRVAVPGLNGPSALSFAAAQAALAAVHLTATPTSQYSDTVAKGQVIGTVPPTGTVVIVGTPVTVEISLGPHLVAVPNVVTESVGAASQQLENDGFQVSGVTGNPISTVTGTSPGAGILAHIGSAVQIITN
jgi:eukaryotic-like serine/threonine-protein kinase